MSTTPDRILLVRFHSIGDVMMGLPVLNTLRTRYPLAEIAWLVEDTSAALLYGHIALDRLIIAKKEWIKSLDEMRLLRKRLLGFAPDVTIDLQNNFKSSMAAWLSGAKTRIGASGQDARECSRWINNIRVLPTEENIIQRNLQLLQPLGIYGSSIDFDLPESETDRWTVARIRHELGMEGNFALFHVGAVHSQKQWRPNRFTTMAVYLREQWNLPTVVVGGMLDERNMATHIVAQSSGAAQLAPMLTLPELAVLTKRATLFIGNDSGPLQIAGAVGTPAVGLFGPTNGRRFRPFGSQNRMVQSPSGTMDGIEGEMVMAACDSILMEITALQQRLQEEENHRFSQFRRAS